MKVLVTVETCFLEYGLSRMSLYLECFTVPGLYNNVITLLESLVKNSLYLMYWDTVHNLHVASKWYFNYSRCHCLFGWSKWYCILLYHQLICTVFFSHFRAWRDLMRRRNKVLVIYTDSFKKVKKEEKRETRKKSVTVYHWTGIFMNCYCYFAKLGVYTAID